MRIFQLSVSKAIVFLLLSYFHSYTLRSGFPLKWTYAIIGAYAFGPIETYVTYDQSFDMPS